MNELKIFKNVELNTEIRSLMINNEPWFVAKDVCDALGIKNVSDAISSLRKKSKGVVSTDTLQTSGGIQSVSIVNEQGMYMLIMQSRKPEAINFQLWVTGDVLPSIRKHGMYATDNTIENMINNPDFAIELLTTLKEERQLRVKTQNKLNNVVEASNQLKSFVLDEDTEYTMSEFAKLISNNIEGTINHTVGRNGVLQFMRDMGIIQKTSDGNEPYQQYISNGYTKVKIKEIKRSNGDTMFKKSTVVTPRGVVRLSKPVTDYIISEIEKLN